MGASPVTLGSVAARTALLALWMVWLAGETEVRATMSSSTTCASESTNPLDYPNSPQRLGCLDPDYDTTEDDELDEVACPTPQVGQFNNIVGKCYKAAVIGCPTAINPAGVLRDRVVLLKISDPPAGTLERGTVVMLTGFGGAELWEDFGFDHKPSRVTDVWNVANHSAAEAVQTLNDSGYRTVQIASFPLGTELWWAADTVAALSLSHDVEQEGLRRAACRAATVIKWVYNKYVACSDCSPSELAFGGTGNSAGASQLAYALDEQRLGTSTGGEVFDLVVYTSGPVFQLLKQGCQTAEVIFTGTSFPGVTEPGYRRSSSAALDTAWGEKGATSGSNEFVGLCSKYLTTTPPANYSCPSGYNTTSVCRADTGSNDAILDANDHVPPGATPATYSNTVQEILTAGDCDPNCCTQSVPCIRGDEAPGSYASIDAYYDEHAAVQSSSSLSITVDQEEQHSWNARIKGAKKTRDTIRAKCVPRP